MPRKLERINVSLDIILEWASGRRQARVSDISLGGCFIDSIANLREGDAVAFQLQVSETEWLPLAGEVVYAMPGFGFGIRFAPLTDQQKILLEHLILMHGGNPWGGDLQEAGA